MDVQITWQFVCWISKWAIEYTVLEINNPLSWVHNGILSPITTQIPMSFRDEFPRVIDEGATLCSYP